MTTPLHFASGPRLSAILADHDRRLEYALVECAHGDCAASARVEDSDTLTTAALVELFEAMGWTVGPTRCPDHAGAGR